MGNESAAWNGSWSGSNVSRELRARLDRDDHRVESLRANRSTLERYADGDDPAVREALACADSELDEAAAIAAAGEAARDDDETALRGHLEDAEGHLSRAADCLASGWEASRDRDEQTRTTDGDDRTWDGDETWTAESSA